MIVDKFFTDFCMRDIILLYVPQIFRGFFYAGHYVTLCPAYCSYASLHPRNKKICAIQVISSWSFHLNVVFVWPQPEINALYAPLTRKMREIMKLCMNLLGM